MKPLLALNNSCFAACRKGKRMLITLSAVAGHNFISVQMNRQNLIRDEIIRGKSSLRQNQMKQSVLEERSPSAPLSNHE
jgi:hypothetical protein